MSETFVEAVVIDDVQPHPNADRLEVARVKGYTVVVAKDAFKAGDSAAYFPPDILIPDVWADRLGVTKYLKHAVYSEGEGASQCRVAGCRLRGQPSFGFLANLDHILEPAALECIEQGEDLSAIVRAKKYTPPTRVTTSEAAEDHPLFHKYTEIENYLRYPNAIPEGTPVRITEKIHGTNCRVGYVPNGDTWEFMAGSHRLRRKQPLEGRTCMYWEPLSIPGVEEFLDFAAKLLEQPVILFGEVYGPGVQDLDYGISAGKRGFRVFDISIGGEYMPWQEIKDRCYSYDIEAVPLLYEGPFSHSLIEQYTYGDTTLGTPKSNFKGREGIVITPLEEQFSGVLGGRMILKSISADYLDRKGAQDHE
jgi:RNA ligase (TIGR02306 family)